MAWQSRSRSVDQARTFWLIVAGFLGMSSKFVECTLGVIFRRENPDGSVSGGPMYYLERGLAQRGLPTLGKIMGSFYALGIVVGCLGIGNMFQSNLAPWAVSSSVAFAASRG